MYKYPTSWWWSIVKQSFLSEVRYVKAKDLPTTFSINVFIVLRRREVRWARGPWCRSGWYLAWRIFWPSWRFFESAAFIRWGRINFWSIRRCLESDWSLVKILYERTIRSRSLMNFCRTFTCIPLTAGKAAGETDQFMLVVLVSDGVDVVVEAGGGQAKSWRCTRWWKRSERGETTTLVHHVLHASICGGQEALVGSCWGNGVSRLWWLHGDQTLASADDRCFLKDWFFHRQGARNLEIWKSFTLTAGLASTL